MISFFHSSTYFNVSVPLFSFNGGRSNSLESRFFCLWAFLGLFILIPFILVFKTFKSAFRLIGVLLGGSFLLMTLGISSGIREFFMRRVLFLFKDLMDWLLLPFALVTCSIRLLLASIILPSFFLPD